MFGLSFTELVIIAVVALVAVGPQKLPGMLRTLGAWVRKVRILTTEVRNQTGIDELLRSEGIAGGLDELRQLRNIVREHQGTSPFPAPRVTAPAAGEPSAAPDMNPQWSARGDPYAEIEPDPTREYPPEGADSYGALAEDLVAGAANPVTVLSNLASSADVLTVEVRVAAAEQPAPEALAGRGVPSAPENPVAALPSSDNVLPATAGSRERSASERSTDSVTPPAPAPKKDESARS